MRPIFYLSSETTGKSIDIPYGFTKTAINSLVVVCQVYRKGIRVNSIAPVVTSTDVW